MQKGINFIDAHTHIHFPAYGGEQEAVFGRAKAAGVKMITVGTQFSTSRGAVEFARRHKGDVWATAGFHPAHFSDDWYHDKNEQEGGEREIFDIKSLREVASAPEVVAIGECGLDYYRISNLKSQNSKLEIQRQKEGFLAQIELAHELGKPLMIHCRAAFDDLIDVLKANRPLLRQGFGGQAGVIHFFSGTEDDAKKLIDLDFAFTFGGVITFSRDYDEVIEMIPTSRILSETDAPYVAPVPYRGKRNEPAYVVEVVKKLAEIKGVEADEMSESIIDNAKNIFGLDDIS